MTMLDDTRPHIAAAQIALLRRAGLTRRVQLAAELTDFAIEGARSALRRRHPTASQREIGLLFVEQHYGSELASRVRAALASDENLHAIIS